MAVRTSMSVTPVGTTLDVIGMVIGGGGVDQEAGTREGGAGVETGNQEGAEVGTGREVEAVTGREARGPGQGAEREGEKRGREEKVLELRKVSMLRKSQLTVVTTISMAAMTTRGST